MTIVNTSEKKRDSQIPSTCHNKGKVNTNMIWKTSVLQNDITALIKPLLREVKKADPNIANPAKK